MAGKTITLALELDDSGAVKNLEQLQGELKQVGVEAKKAETAAEDLGESLKRQEARIKTLGGAINIVGGAVEVAIGSFVALGLASEETAKQYEELLLTGIALADGTKRIQEGYKELNEGLEAYGGVAGAAKKATTALFNVIKANPIAAIATAIAGLIAIYATWKQSTEGLSKAQIQTIELTNELNEVTRKAALSEERLLEILTDGVEQRGLEKQAIEDLKKAYPGFIAFLDSENKLTEQGIAFLNARIKLRKAEAGLGAVAQKQVEAEVELARQYAQIDIDEDGRFTQRRANRRQAARDERNVILAELKTLSDQYSAEINDALLELDGFNKILEDNVTNTDNYNTIVKPFIDNLAEVRHQVSLLNQAAIDSAFKQEGTILNVKYVGDLDTSLAALSQTLTDLKDDFEVLNEEETFKFLSFPQELLDRLSGKTPQGELDAALAARKAQYDKEYNLLAGNLFRQKQLTEEYEKDVAKIKRDYALSAASETLKATTGLLATIRETTDDGSKEGFERSKKFRIAETRLSSIQAAFDAYKSLAGIPVVGQALGIAASIAALAAGQKAINDIKASTYQDQNAPSNPVAGASTGGGTRTPNISAQFAQGGFLGPAGGGTPQLAPEQPIQAYVLASDVTTGLQAYGQISRRRRFG